MSHNSWLISFQTSRLQKIPLSLNHASLMLDRLRNTGYTPKQYNELFMTITNELRHLDIFIDDLFSRDHMVRNFNLKWMKMKKMKFKFWTFRWCLGVYMSGCSILKIFYRVFIWWSQLVWGWWKNCQIWHVMSLMTWLRCHVVFKGWYKN